MLRLREMNKEFDDIDIVHDIGIGPNTVKLLCKRIRTTNGKRPAAHRKTVDQMAEKLLECIFTTSKHFSQSALTEYNATAANRQFRTAAGGRDLTALENHYHTLWENAVNARLPGFCPPITNRVKDSTRDISFVVFSVLFTLATVSPSHDKPGSPLKTTHW